MFFRALEGVDDKRREYHDTSRRHARKCRNATFARVASRRVATRRAKICGASRRDAKRVAPKDVARCVGTQQRASASEASTPHKRGSRVGLGTVSGKRLEIIWQWVGAGGKGKKAPRGEEPKVGDEFVMRVMASKKLRVIRKVS